MINIIQINEPKESYLPELCNLLLDAVNNGASLGFLSDLNDKKAKSYWLHVFSSLSGGMVLWVAEEEGNILGSVQLSMCQKENGQHRAEVQKLFVHSTARGKGISSLLMNTLEMYALDHYRTLLVLDTQTGSKAEQVYQHLGWINAGEIPDYASSPDGTLHPTSIYYKKLTA
jgi:GNAT superfamily N-acetyltransferase